MKQCNLKYSAKKPILFLLFIHLLSYCVPSVNEPSPAILLALVSPTFTVNTSFQLPDSNQTTCYDAAGGTRSCTGSGEDGSYLNTPAPYNLTITDAGETITETSSGLIWTRCIAGRVWDGSTCVGGSNLTLQWPSAMAYCTQLTTANRRWRLPSTREANLLPDYNLTSLPLLSTVFFPTAPTIQFWTSTPGVNADNYYAYSTNGSTSILAETTTLGVRCVSDPIPPSPDFTDQGDGTVVESGSGLIIKKCAIGQTDDASCTGTPTALTWQQAIDACEGLNFASRTNWRLPSVREGYHLIDATWAAGFSQNLPIGIFPNGFLSSNFWTGTSVGQAGQTSNAYYISVSNITTADKGTTIRARCVANP
ncbi:DUF1566 domain-containing protein [Leptospira sp. WS58.C1]|uniref:Lcl C-terminal domain-containing protein n=1 Tax=Leptospira cinconiae TaxID=3235173 RepID=UPI00349EF3A8